MGDIKAEIYLDRVGRFQARVGDITRTGHPIHEDSGRFIVHSILARKPALLSFNATREVAETNIGNEWAVFAMAHMPLTSREFELHFDDMRPEQRIAHSRLRGALAEKALRPMLKSGDRLRANKAQCGAREASFTFSHWEGGWIVSTGKSSIAPNSVYSVNGQVFRV